MPAQRLRCELIVIEVRVKAGMAVPRLLCSILKRSPVALNQGLFDGFAGSGSLG